MYTSDELTAVYETDQRSLYRLDYIVYTIGGIIYSLQGYSCTAVYKLTAVYDNSIDSRPCIEYTL